MSQCSFGKSHLGVGLVAVVIASGFIGAAGAAQPSKLDHAAAFRGESTFRALCSSCHGKQAKGDGPLADDLKVRPANLTELSNNHGGEFPYEMVIDTIEHGRDVRGHGTEDMPAWGDAFEMTSQSETEARGRMTDLAHYLWSLQP